MTERRKLLLTMLDAVYADTHDRCVVAIKHINPVNSPSVGIYGHHLDNIP